MKRAALAGILVAAGLLSLWAGPDKEKGSARDLVDEEPQASGREAEQGSGQGAAKQLSGAAGGAQPRGSEQPAVDKKIGEMAYLDGEVGVSRSGRRMDSRDIAMGMDVENFDYVSTGENGSAEIEITSEVCPGALLRVDPRTTFYLEITRVNEATDTTQVSVLRGSLMFKVKKITGDQEVLVRTDNTVLGVRGTEFRVLMSPGGDTLVSCREGVVEVRDEERAVTAEPGRVVEKLSGGSLRAVSVALDELERYERDWFAGRIEALESNALRATRYYASQYDRRAREFRESFLDMVEQNGDTIARWVEEDREGRTGGAVELMQQKKELIGDLFRVKRQITMLERVYYRLLELGGYHARGVGQGELSDGSSTAEFFRRFEGERAELEQDMLYVRYTMMLYARRNDGTFPADELSGEEFLGGAGSF